MNDVTPLYIVGEGKIISKFNNTVSIIQAVAVLLGCLLYFQYRVPNLDKKCVFISKGWGNEQDQWSKETLFI